MNTDMMKEIVMIEKKIKCMHCGNELVVNNHSTDVVQCECGKIAMNNGIITEGMQGTDWVDVSPRLLNE